MTRLLTMLFAGLLALPGVALGQGAPRQLYNKSIVLSWGQDQSVREPDGRIVRPNVQVDRQVYISGAGRLFIKTSVDVRNRRYQASSTGHRGPGDASRGGSFRFHGATLMGIFPFVSGARQLIVTFNPEFTTCTLTVTFGKTGGRNIVWKRAGDQQIREILSVRATNPTCSIRDGNVFAGTDPAVALAASRG